MINWAYKAQAEVKDFHKSILREYTLECRETRQVELMDTTNNIHQT